METLLVAMTAMLLLFILGLFALIVLDAFQKRRRKHARAIELEVLRKGKISDLERQDVLDSLRSNPKPRKWHDYENDSVTVRGARADDAVASHLSLLTESARVEDVGRECRILRTLRVSRRDRRNASDSRSGRF